MLGALDYLIPDGAGPIIRQLFVSRPREEARSAPLADIVTVTSGRNCPVGARYVRIGEGADARITLEP